MDLQHMLNQAQVIARRAGSAIMDIYAKEDLGVEFKDDESPLTLADTAAHNILIESLTELSDDPIMSEEGASIDWETRSAWTRYWLLDPLDGTKEFIKRNGEFTVNIALIENGVPILGVVYAPAKNLMYFGASGIGAFKQSDTDSQVESIRVSQSPSATSVWKIVGSRSHQSDDFLAFVKNISNKEIVAMGSSLKLCSVADGTADLYPRLGLTSEWDTAAAQAVVEAAGGKVINWETLQPLRYNSKESLLNPYFIVCSEPSVVWMPETPII